MGVTVFSVLIEYMYVRVLEKQGLRRICEPKVEKLRELVKITL